MCSEVDGMLVLEETLDIGAADSLGGLLCPVLALPVQVDPGAGATMNTVEDELTSARPDLALAGAGRGRWRRPGPSTHCTGPGYEAHQEKEQCEARGGEGAGLGVEAVRSVQRLRVGGRGRKCCQWTEVQQALVRQAERFLMGGSRRAA
eukprot:2376338-Pleurochrysis_carterae.AAC.1